jgi:glycosyltransferase involved in cell wall biosynthesis
MEQQYKVLHISTWDCGGGAANATRTLMNSQLDYGLDVSMYSGFKTDLDPRVFSNKIYFSPLSQFLPFYSQIKGLSLQEILKRDRTFEFSSNPNKALIDRMQLKFFQNFDIIHMHWISSGLISNQVLLKLNKPIIWTLCDMWPMTGGCHYSGNCDQFKASCGNCPIINSTNLYDISFKNLFIRHKALKHKRLIIVGKSNWISKSARESTLFKDFDVHTIGNIVNTDFFQPNSKKPTNSRSLKIGIGGLNSLRLRRKNSINIEDLIKELLLKKYKVVLFGTTLENLNSFPYLLECVTKKAIDFSSKTEDPSVLKRVYDTFDVYIHTAKYENLSNQIMEILACGIPVIAFNIGGNQDLVSHNWNGYLINEVEIAPILSSLEDLISTQKYSFLSKNARYHMMKNYTKDIIVSKYKQIYSQILEDQ